MKDRFKNIISNKNTFIIIYLIIALSVSTQSLLLEPSIHPETGIEYNKYNNYTIFEKSFYHLENNQDLYEFYLEEHWDLFKYTPTFSVFFGIFALFPDWIGLSLWNLLNVFTLLFAIYYLPKLDKFEKGAILLIVLIELITSIQNAQSNALMAGLLVFSFGLLENKKYLLATLLIVFSIYIKLFGIIGFVLFIFYPKKWKLAVYTIAWTVLLFAIPLLFIDFTQYINLIQSYWNMLSNDHSISYGYSVMGLLNVVTDIGSYRNIIVIVGAIILLIPMIKIREYNNYLFKYLTLASILIWVVIFNHKAESPTFIIAITGVALWFVKSKMNIINIVLFIAAIVLTSLSPTDLFPASIRDEFIIPYSLKVLPCILIWIKIIYDVMVIKPGDTINTK